MRKKSGFRKKERKKKLRSGMTDAPIRKQIEIFFNDSEWKKTLDSVISFL